jgi:hypothetical protein
MATPSTNTGFMYSIFRSSYPVNFQWSVCDKWNLKSKAFSLSYIVWTSRYRCANTAIAKSMDELPPDPSEYAAQSVI